MKKITIQERDHLCGLMNATKFSILESLVKTNGLKPLKLGASYCDFDINNSLSFIWNSLTNDDINKVAAEKQYSIDMTLRQLCCYKFLSHFGITEEQQDEFKEYVLKHEDDFNDYYQSACSGYNQRLNEYLINYPELKKCYSVFG